MPTLKEVLDAYNAIKDVNITASVKFNYGLAKLKKQLEKEADTFKEAIKPEPKFEEYENKRNSLILDYAKRDADGKVVQINDNAVELDEDKKTEFYEKLAKLDKEYEEVIKKRKQQAEEINKLLESEIQIDLYKIKFEDLPEEIETRLMDALITLDVISD